MPTHHEHVIGPEDAGRTLEAVVRAILDGVPWSRARELTASGRVAIDGVVVTEPARRVALGWRVTVEPGGRRLRGPELPADAIVHLDRDIVVVRKPAGIVTAPYDAGEAGTLVDLTRAELRRRAGYGGELGVVSRLDKDTTGLVVFARTDEARAELERQFSEHTVERAYLALAHGRPPEGRVESVLVADRGDGIRGSQGRFVAGRRQSRRGAQPAVTHVRVLERLPAASLVECRLETGRQHQVRIHLAEAGCPVLGEPTYIRDFRGPFIPAPRPMLHAAVLGFRHPRTGRDQRWEDPPPADFAALLLTLRHGPGKLV